MRKRKLAILISGLLSLSALLGCGGEDSGSREGSVSTPNSKAVVTKTYDIQAIDGYLENALVWLDKNSNSLLDEGEPSAMSAENGIAKIDVTNELNPEQYMVLVQAVANQTIDIGLDVENPQHNLVTVPFVMSAPPGETVVTPLSTLVSIKLEKLRASRPLESLMALQHEATRVIAQQYSLASDQILGNFLARDNQDVAYVAVNLVKSQILPNSPSKMAQIIEQVKQDEPVRTMDDGSIFLAQNDVVAKRLRERLSMARKDAILQGGTEEVSFIGLENVFEQRYAFVDSDGDGVSDHLDEFPMDPFEWVNSDSFHPVNRDDIGDNADEDDDGDGYRDDFDSFPLDPNEWLDSDDDFIGNNRDLDDDNDGVMDEEDVFPLDLHESIDSDSDGIGNNADIDDDGDGVDDELDVFPLDSTESKDADLDGLGNNQDTDDDNDGVVDGEDAFPFDPQETMDTDQDGVGNHTDHDDDGDGIADVYDNTPLEANAPLDVDSDSITNDNDLDDDNDGYEDLVDGNDPHDVTKFYDQGSHNVALRQNGSVVTWARSSHLYQLPLEQAKSLAQQLNGDIAVIDVVVNNAGAQAALRSDGSVITWGGQSPYSGGNSNYVADQIDGSIPVVEVIPVDHGFVAVREDHSLIGWGKMAIGMDTYINFQDVADKFSSGIPIVSVHSNSGSYAALKQNGSVVTWGAPSKGGSSNSIASFLNGEQPVTKIVPTRMGFAAIREDGSLVVWGGYSFTDCTDAGAILDDTVNGIEVVDIVTSGNSVLALNSDGSVLDMQSDDFCPFRDFAVTTRGVVLDGTQKVAKLIPHTKSNNPSYAVVFAKGGVDVIGNFSAEYVESYLNSDSNPVVEVFPSYYGYFATREDHSIVKWSGISSIDEDIDNVLLAFSSIGFTAIHSSLMSSSYEDVAILNDGSARIWKGRQGFSSDSHYFPSYFARELNGENGIVDASIFESQMAFILEDGSVSFMQNGHTRQAFPQIEQQVDGSIKAIQLFSGRVVLREDGGLVFLDGRAVPREHKVLGDISLLINGQYE